ncbi:helix-turn-helix domain-containing protein [Glycomyces dulcitolivorans]|uniref:helix-turn-helix domain-containing protein n=1 Tax=Glycomyces dulcitolivorans TaxID=2200759 RepID=UPI000DD4DB32|nr:helix-turn-helix domain-containing protein [Glycomyces dulcitolivorans]
MVTSGHLGGSAPDASSSAPAPLYGFQPPVGTPYGLEVTTIEDFFDRHDDWPWNPPRPGRAAFHYLILVTSGELLHDVDHVTRTVVPGQWLWVRPGHTQCWHAPGTARGPFILFEQEVLRPETAPLLAAATAHDAPAVLAPGADAHWAEQTAFQLLDEHRAFGRRPLELHHALRRSLLEALLLRLAHAPGIAAPPPPAAVGDQRASTYRQFLDALELHFRELHRADDYSRLLGCSTRTLTRAAHAAAGTGAREVIDERRLLEARRLLATGRTAAAVAAHLGFPDAANFGRFFRSRTGLSPAAYAARQAHQDAEPDRQCPDSGS